MGVDYMTYVILDENIRLIQSSNGTITYNLSLIVEEGKDGKRFDTNSRMIITSEKPGVVSLNVREEIDLLKTMEIK